MADKPIWDDRDLQQALAQLIATHPETVAWCIEQACIDIEGEAKDRCPNAENGTVRASITRDLNVGDKVVEGTVGTNNLIAIYIHQGTGIFAVNGDGRKEVPWTYKDDKTGEFFSTKGMHPNPFLRDAAEVRKPKILRFFKDVFAGHVRPR